MDVPTYDELPLHEALPMRHSWGVFGSDDDLGTVNHLDAANTVNARDEIRSGSIYNLTLPLDLPNPPWSPTRKPYEHHIYFTKRDSQDDYIDRFQPQGSTQWDALRHHRAREHGFYNGVTPEDAGPDGDRLSIDAWADHGIVGRGVLADVASFMEHEGTPIDPRSGTEITSKTLRDVLEWQGTALRPADILLLRTGYTDAYVRASVEERVDFSVQRDCPGLSADEETARFLWDARIAAVAADNPAVECVPGSREKGSLHRRLIPMLGFAIGEFFTFKSLSEHCAKEKRYTCFFVAVPLNLPRGVGSPGNAIAIV